MRSAKVLLEAVLAGPVNQFNCGASTTPVPRRVRLVEAASIMAGKAVVLLAAVLCAAFACAPATCIEFNQVAAWKLGIFTNSQVKVCYTSCGDGATNPSCRDSGRKTPTVPAVSFYACLVKLMLCDEPAFLFVFYLVAC